MGQSGFKMNLLKELAQNIFVEHIECTRKDEVRINQLDYKPEKREKKSISMGNKRLYENNWILKI